MELSITIKQGTIDSIKAWVARQNPEVWLLIIGVLLAISASVWSYLNGYTAAYGDSESHLNISKRVVHSLTPGFAQLGGIWLPLPHILMMPFVYFDFLWRTGLAGSIVSGVAFLVSTLFLYRTTFLLTASKAAGFVAGLVFLSNPNVLYMQTTPMTEVLLICFFLLSSYYFIRYIKNTTELTSLLLAAFFGLCATVSRYDGWFLVAVEAGVLVLMYLPWRAVPKKLSQIREYFDKERWKKLEGTVLMFCAMACFGIGLWFLWDYLILGDPFYFTNSEFSAATQQGEWARKGMLVTQHNLWLSFLYYFVTFMSNTGVFITLVAIAGLVYYLASGKGWTKYFVLLILVVPFIFNVLTLFLGQSVIFIPHLTPSNFEWKLFNARYGLMMVPTAAVLVGYFFYRIGGVARLALGGLAAAQIMLFVIGYSPVITFADGVRGLSSATANIPQVQQWMVDNYDGGLVLVDDYARTLSIIRSDIPMQNIIYIGNRGWWDDSFIAPEKYATWIVMQKNDALWSKLYDDPLMLGRVYKYFNKAYTSPDVVVFRRNPNVPIQPGDEIPSTIPGAVTQQ